MPQCSILIMLFFKVLSYHAAAKRGEIERLKVSEISPYEIEYYYVTIFEFLKMWDLLRCLHDDKYLLA